MLGEHALNPVAIDRIAIAVSNDPRQFASGEGLGRVETHNKPLVMPGQEHVRTRFPPRMGQGGPIDEAQEAIVPKAPQIPP
jgi:hypothetical protein